VCTAAIALLKYPAAEVIISSAQRIGQTLAELCQQRRLPKEVHVCGVGVRGDWDQVARPARELRKKGCSIICYCGRGDLDRDRHAAVCLPVFWDASSNTEAVGHIERERIHLTVERLRRQMNDTMDPLPRRSLTAADEAAIHRRVVRQALVALGILSVTWRSITLPLKPKKRARIM
jgi:hypothetical protein